jgi:hypothetical protein
MHDSQEKNDTSDHLSNAVTDKSQYFISDKKFSLVKKCQKAIFEATESSPSVRKIINELITEENLLQIKMKFIEVWK